MGLFKRVADILSANISELVEKCEDPEKLLKQAIREMDDSLKAAVSDTAKVLANQKKLEKDLERAKEDGARQEGLATRAVEAGNDDEARAALVRKSEYDQIVTDLEQQVVGARNSTDVLKQNIETMKAKLDEAKRSLATLSARQKAAAVRKKAITSTGSLNDLVVDDSATAKFDRMREKVEAAEAEAEALAELHGVTDLATGTSVDIEDQLAALKKKAESRE